MKQPLFYKNIYKVKLKQIMLIIEFQNTDLEDLFFRGTSENKMYKKLSQNKMFMKDLQKVYLNFFYGIFKKKEFF